MHVYIAPEPGNPVLRRCTVLLSLTQTCFHPTHISTHKGAYINMKQPSTFIHVIIIYISSLNSDDSKTFVIDWSKDIYIYI